MIQTEQTFFSHLDELRNRVCWCVIAIGIGVIAGWFLYPFVFPLLAGPIMHSIHAHGGKVVTMRPADAFMMQMRLAGVLGLLLTSPVVIWQLWAFIRPGLHPHERRAVTPLLPAFCGLFLLGAFVAYLFLAPMTDFFLACVPASVEAYIDFQQTIDLPLKLILAFGLTFQLPLLVLGLVWLRVLDPAQLLSQWRVAIMIIAVIAAVITPTTDPLSMTLMMIPLILLYFGTILVARRLRRRELSGGEVE